MEYRVIRHKEGDERENHKYVARVETKDPKRPYRYFYTMPAYNAYLKGSTKTFNLKDMLQKGISAVNSFMKNTTITVKSQVDKSVQKGKDAVDKLVNKAEENTKKTVDTVTSATVTTAKKTADKAITTTEDILTESPKLLNKVVDKAKEVASKVYDDKDNIYDVKSSNYDEKIKKIAETPEWKAIVESGDPEYVKKLPNGENQYLIDDYLAKKKQPLFDIIDDIANQRPITINRVEKDAIVAGLKQQVFGKITLGMIAVGAASKVMLEASKVSQGSYDEELENMYNSIDAGMQSTKAFTSDTYSISDAEVERMVKIAESTRKVTELEKAAKKVSEEDVVTAAKILMESDYISDDVKANEYYQKAETTLNNLSEEEIIMLNILLNSMGGKR